MFQSTPPVGGDTSGKQFWWDIATVSIHAPRRGRYGAEAARFAELLVSIHAPRRGRYTQHHKGATTMEVSIHAPRRGRYSDRSADIRELMVSIHAPRRGRYRVHLNPDAIGAPHSCFANPPPISCFDPPPSPQGAIHSHANPYPMRPHHHFANPPRFSCPLQVRDAFIFSRTPNMQRKVWEV